ncbi:hypothetical protein E2C01_100579 [Portunus trituberculatus]|uniref:Uncharacterized protein n=1 Tax=Portunus trituberculatus TaxID=210409 RepID=A0A5B7KHY0_PORTR|nr:hypothetical protein [Portunus trituberculatus]
MKLFLGFTLRDTTRPSLITILRRRGLSGGNRQAAGRRRLKVTRNERMRGRSHQPASVTLLMPRDRNLARGHTER